MNEAAPIKRLGFTMLHDEHPLRIEAAPGSSRRLIVSFTSVGTERGKWPPREFVGMASQGGNNHVMCVSDISRCWMNSDGMDGKIVTAISDYVMDHGITSIMTIGTSMGAYNALVLGRKFPVDRVIAFAPQYSVHPDVMPDEDRWQWFIKQIKEWPHKEMKKLPRRPAKIFMFHGDTPDEQRHWKRFGVADNLTHYIFCGANHNFISNLKRDQKLNQIVRAAINNRPGRLGKVVRRAAGVKRHEYEDWAAANSFFATRRKRSRPAALGA